VKGTRKERQGNVKGMDGERESEDVGDSPEGCVAESHGEPFACFLHLQALRAAAQSARRHGGHDAVRGHFQHHAAGPGREEVRQGVADRGSQ
jgi:hypothetical protein